MRRGLCVVAGCEHRHEPGWVHVPPDTRRPTVLAHLRARVADESEAAA